MIQTLSYATADGGKLTVTHVESSPLADVHVQAADERTVATVRMHLGELSELLRRVEAL